MASELLGEPDRLQAVGDPHGLDDRPGDGTLHADPGPEPAAPGGRARPTQLGWWLLIVAGIVFAMVVVGGATRLTQSGLSITSWKPVSGVVPPLTAADWRAEFDHYKSTPEYRLVNPDMKLSQFKGIFWWEYAHRLLGRIIGLALVVPFVWFLVRRAIPPGYGKRVTLLIALVGLQGAIGWWMVASGLENRPEVAHERLALHLVTALVLLAALVWTALDLRALGAGRSRVDGRPTRWILPFSVLLLIQLVLGAFVAGLKAGHMDNTWPTMNGDWVPHGVARLSPVWSNAVDNPVTVQFLHRWMAVVVAVAALGVAALLFRAGARTLATVLEVVVLVQFLLGVLTLLHAVPVALGVAHQAVATLLLVVTVVAAHWATGGARRASSPDMANQRRSADHAASTP
ncbi:MAG: COX15/CtaA family protein [Acidimicrobiia bacterium]